MFWKATLNVLLGPSGSTIGVLLFGGFADARDFLMLLGFYLLPTRSSSFPSTGGGLDGSDPTAHLRLIEVFRLHSATPRERRMNGALAGAVAGQIGRPASARRPNDPPPALTLKALLDFGGNTDHGLLVRAVALPWFQIMEIIQNDPNSLYEIDWRRWEEIIAGAYTQAGFDEVVLTPRSGDGGKDIIAVKKGIGSIRIFDQVKAYRPPHLVSAEEVRAMLGVITAHQNVSKGIITTTSEFAPRVMDDPAVAAYVPYRLELKPRGVLLPWLADLANGQD